MDLRMFVKHVGINKEVNMEYLAVGTAFFTFMLVLYRKTTVLHKFYVYYLRYELMRKGVEIGGICEANYNRKTRV